MSKAIALLFKVFLTGFEEWRTTPQIDKHNSQIKKINKNKGWLFRSFHLVYNTVFVHVNSLQIWRDHTKLFFFFSKKILLLNKACKAHQMLGGGGCLDLDSCQMNKTTLIFYILYHSDWIHSELTITLRHKVTFYAELYAFNNVLIITT